MLRLAMKQQEAATESLRFKMQERALAAAPLALRPSPAAGKLIPTSPRQFA
jgi:hypothetical protein